MSEYICDEKNDKCWDNCEEIVRCRDCAYFEQGYTDGAVFDATVCWGWDNGHDYPSHTVPNGFCWRGERKED